MTKSLTDQLIKSSVSGMSVKKIRTIILALLILISGFQFDSNQIAEAANTPTNNEEKPYQTGAWFEDGKLVFVSPNKKASSSTRYGTKAFVVRTDQTCTDKNAPVTDPLNAECTPTRGDSKQDYLRIDLYENSQHKKIWDVDDIGECDYLSKYSTKQEYKGVKADKLQAMGACQQAEYGASADKAVLVARFVTDKEMFADELSAHPKFEKLKDGMTVYLNSIFLIKEGNTTLFNPEYTSLSGIRNARGWANKTYFRNYYDVPVEFKGSYPLTVQYLKTSDRTDVQSSQEILSTYGPEDVDGYKEGLWPAWKYSKDKSIDGKGIFLPETIIGSDGKTYALQCSYITRVKAPEELNCEEKNREKGNEPYFWRDHQLKERNPPVYVKGTIVVALYTDNIDCNCRATATIPGKKDLEGEVPADNTKIGQKVTMQVDLTQDKDSLEDWKKWMSDKTDFTIRIRTYRSDQTDKLPNLANTGAKPIWSKAGKLEPDDGSTPTTINSVSKDELINYLKGGQQSLVKFVDDLMNYPIPEGGTVSFRYNAGVYISAKDKSGKVIEKQCTQAPSTEMTWYRPKKDPPEIGQFFSVPKYYSEIKEGSPQLSGTSANETFDAMSGTPTTRSLYFASGGSEFIVDIEVQYVPQVTQTRNYKSEFTSVVNGWAMSSITGGASTDSIPSRPAARKMTDACGASYTENVTLQSRSYTVGSPPGPVTSHTDYWWVQEGHDSRKVGGYEDTWTQTVTFDYMKINKAVVWKLDKSKVDGMTTLIRTNEVTASITQGDPNIFYNIAQDKTTSAAGRLRYSVETNQHDNVYWNEGPSDNCLTNSKDSGPVKEQDKFTQRRNTTGNVTVISDFLILQTSSGDQSVMYFDKKSNTAKVTDQLDVPITDFDTMWTNNPLSAAKWSKTDTIKVGSYNGNFGVPTSKYSGASTGTVSTVFDAMPAGLNRPSRPAPYLRLMATGLNPVVTLPNGLYFTGSSTVFYKNILNNNVDHLPSPYPVINNGRYNDIGLEFASAYSPTHSKVNDVVLHNPVSVEHALVISLPNSLDQRTPASKAIGGNKQEGVAEYERVLDPNYRQNIISNPDAEIVNVDKTVAGWNKWVASGSASNITFTSRTGDSWVIGGTHSFEVNSLGSSGATGGYWKDVPVKPNTQYRFEGDLSCHRCVGYFALDAYTANMTYAGLSIGATDTVANTGTVQHKTFTFTTPANAAYVRIHMIKGNNVDSTSNPRDHLFADNLSLKNMSAQEFIAVDPVYVTEQVPNPDYQPPTTGANVAFEYTGSVQTFTAPDDGVYTIEAWGAQGGTGCQKGCSGSGGRGGYSKGDITLKKGEILNIYVGGQGGNTGAGGWNGGGNAASSNGGGGGGTDVRKGGTALSHRIIVAGGGGGGGSGATGGAGGGLTGGAGTSTSEVRGGSGGSQTGGYSLGSGGSVSSDASAGGGGYYGGYGAETHACSNPNAGGGGGSGYIGGVSNGTMSTGVNSGHGKVVIKSPPREAVGLPTIIVTTLAGGSESSPPSDAYILVPRTVDPNAPAGGYSPGNFVLLDYGFQLYYPNTGDFFGNGQWGWAQTTATRGKGFVNGMDTTEWTKEKYVKFDFNVIYDNAMYLAHEWIQLPLNSPSGDWKYDFYVPLANREKISAMVEWKSIAINAPSEDNDTPTNKIRYGWNLAAKHSTLKKYQVDVVGRIGNMVIEDTGDFRFSNLFKQALVPTEWLIPNVVKKVNPNLQNKIIGDTINIRGHTVTAGTKYLNTWGLLDHLEQSPIPFPLSPEKNNIDALKNQPLRIGYDVLSDIQTMGNYYSHLQIIPYYYHLNLQNGAITPVDIYMDVNGEYKVINRFGAAAPGWDPSSVYAHSLRLDWDNQAGRRNVTAIEGELTSRIAGLFAQSGGDSESGKAAEPFGSFPYGTSQLMTLTGKNRTYIGQDRTYGSNKNPGTRLSMLEYAMQAQRWHYSYVLPSSAVAVKQGLPATQANINALRTNTGVLLLAADIKAAGDTYTLQYNAPDGNGRLHVAGTSWPLTSIPYPVVAVYSANKSSADDLAISGTH
ncbi:glycine-rich protein [Paenibacillaceae bacterium WGS1546]|uniref:glycine-rich protein n=1 Tax=Cohnella sp. WGS1546 TaxID=3366810 RepID=UPI00372CEC9F